MKPTLLFLALVTALCGQPAEAETGKLLFSAGPSVDVTGWQTSSLVLSAGKGQITINLKTGQVDLPKDMTLPDAAVAFWLRVAQCFPEVRQAIITGDPTPKTVEWIDFGPSTTLNANNRPIRIGLRSDGVVIWREAK